MKFETLTYAAAPPDNSGGGAWGPEEALISSPKGADSPARLPDNIAAFLLGVAVYFQGYLSGFPILKSLGQAEQTRITVIDSTAAETREPLQRVVMNRALSRRLRWLMRRGRANRSGEIRLATEDEQSRCDLSPGQFMEYCIRVHRWNRICSYGLGLPRRALRLNAISTRALQGALAAFLKPAPCAAPLSPD